MVETEKPVNIRFKTKDGRSDQVLDFETGKIYDGWAKYNEAMGSKDTAMNTLFALGSKNNAPRKNLYLVTGPKNKVSKADDVKSYLDNPSSLKFFSNATSKPLLPDKGFIEGMIIYEDDDACVIIHQDIADKDSDRRLTCIDASGKMRWEITQEELFEEARVDKDNAFSSAFFMKDKFGAMVQSGVFVFKLEGTGIMGFDYSTGKKLWEVEF
jgi:hypothetical protein